MKLVRINILVEGKTEKTFVKNTLQQHFNIPGYNIIWYPRIYVTSINRRSGKIYKGGGLNFEKIIRELSNWINREYSSGALVLFTTFFDFYKFPVPNQGSLNVSDVENLLRTHIEKNVGYKANVFVPYLQLHEIEAFMLADCQALKQVFGQELDFQMCKEIEEKVENISPEQINQTEDGHPSALIKKVYPAYDKVADFSFFLNYANFQKFLQKMPHFAQWLNALKFKIIQS